MMYFAFSHWEISHLPFPDVGIPTTASQSDPGRSGVMMCVRSCELSAPLPFLYSPSVKVQTDQADECIWGFFVHLILSIYKQKWVNTSVLLFWNGLFFPPVWVLLRDRDPSVSFLYIIGGCSIKLLVTSSPHPLPRLPSSKPSGQRYQSGLFSLSPRLLFRCRLSLPDFGLRGEISRDENANFFHLLIFSTSVWYDTTWTKP